MKSITDIGTLQVKRSQHELWKQGVLASEWSGMFPELSDFFDADFFRFVKNQGEEHEDWAGGYGFFETLAAIMLYHATGYLPLMPTWDFRFPAGKNELVEKLLPENVLAVIRDWKTEFGRTRLPISSCTSQTSRTGSSARSKAPETAWAQQRGKFKAIARASGNQSDSCGSSGYLAVLSRRR